MKGIQTAIRWFLSGILLAEVWGHSHWSVALSLTLVFTAEEIRTWMVQKKGIAHEAK